MPLWVAIAEIDGELKYNYYHAENKDAAKERAIGIYPGIDQKYIIVREVETIKA